MDIEDLTKTQLLLLTLLVNFVTSIAVGVITVSLLDENAPTITQTVNRIVEQAADTVAIDPAIIPSIPRPTPVEPQPTNEELRTQALAESASRVVSVYRGNARTPYATGTYLPGSRAVVIAAGGAIANDVRIVFADGSEAEASRSRSGNGLVIYGFADDATLPQVHGAELVPSSSVSQGMTALGIAAGGTATTGIITKVDASGVYANVAALPAGGTLVNLSGDIIGFSVGNEAFLPTEEVVGLLSAPAS